MATVTKKNKPVKQEETLTPQEKLAQARKAMKDALVERDAEVDLVLTALVAQEHPLLVGAPGSAKTTLMDLLVKWMGDATPKFSLLMTKFTMPEEVFGPVSLTSLKADVYRRVTTGKLPEAEAAFLDEIWKASSAILNTTLRILNERVFENGDGVFRSVPLRIAVAASNEWPNDQDGGRELHALFDRFLFRKKVKNVSRNAGRRELLKRSVANQQPRVKFDPHEQATARDLDLMHDEARNLPLSNDAKKSLWKILEELDKEGVVFGDRRVYKSVLAVRAYAYLEGAAEVQTPHLEILQHVLWDDPTEQPEKAAKVVSKIANPVGSAITEFLIQAESVAESTATIESVPKLQEILNKIKQLGNEPRAVKAQRHVSNLIGEAYNKVVGHQEE